MFDALEWLSAMPGATKPCEECCHMYQIEGNPADAGPVMEFIFGGAIIVMWREENEKRQTPTCLPKPRRRQAIRFPASLNWN